MKKSSMHTKILGLERKLWELESRAWTTKTEVEPRQSAKIQQLGSLPIVQCGKR
jgi:hypothetical protein